MSSFPIYNFQNRLIFLKDIALPKFNFDLVENDKCTT